MTTVNYTPGQILYIKPEYGIVYISIFTGTSPHHEDTMIHTCCDLTIHEYGGNMYEGGITFAREDGTMLDIDTSFEEIRQAEDFEIKMLFNALVRNFIEHNSEWANHFNDSLYGEIRDWLCLEFNVDLDNIDDNPLGITIYEIRDYICDILCKESGNYQKDITRIEMVNKQEFINKCVNYFTPILKTYCSEECVKELISGFVNLMEE